MKPEFTRPFNAEHAKAGAPYCCSDGEEATVLMWERRCEINPLMGVFGTNDALGKWTEHGKFFNPSFSFNLVMLPLGMCEGKPVFTGDELCYFGLNTKVIAKERWRNFYICTWPKPEIEYPTTKLTDGDLKQISEKHYSAEDRLRATADAAIRHAIDVGQVVIVKVYT